MKISKTRTVAFFATVLITIMLISPISALAVEDGMFGKILLKSGLLGVTDVNAIAFEDNEELVIYTTDEIETAETIEKARYVSDDIKFDVKREPNAENGVLKWVKDDDTVTEEYDFPKLSVWTGETEIVLTDHKNTPVVVSNVNFNTDIYDGNITDLIEKYEVKGLEYPIALIEDNRLIGVAVKPDAPIITAPKPVDIGGGKIPLTSPTEESQEAATDDVPESSSGKVGSKFIWVAVGIIILVLICVGIYLYNKYFNKGINAQSQMASVLNNAQTERTEISSGSSVAVVHNIGNRKNQQDNKGFKNLKCGFIGVVADGMGGLSGGERVSGAIVARILQNAEKIERMTNENVLFRLTAAANNAVNSMLGLNGIKSSGSTLIAIFASNGYFHYVSVGDSRIYLYRNGALLQLNREHNYESDLVVEAVNGKAQFSDISTHPKRHGLTSFIGMGRLTHVDGSIRPVKLQNGDKLILMSDGVYNTLSENELCSILKNAKSVSEAAMTIEQRIIGYQKMGQDNFTAIIKEFTIAESEMR